MRQLVLFDMMYPTTFIFVTGIAQKGGHLHPCRQPPLVFYAVFYFSVSENLIQFPFHGARLGEFQRIRLTDMVGGDAVTLCKAQNVADGNAVDDLGGGKPIDLLGKDMLQPGVIVREGLPHLLAAVKALDDFRDVQAGLHVGV